MGNKAFQEFFFYAVIFLMLAVPVILLIFIIRYFVKGKHKSSRPRISREQAIENRKRGEKDFWENPKYAYARGKIVLVVLVIIAYVLYEIGYWIYGLIIGA